MHNIIEIISSLLLFLPCLVCLFWAITLFCDYPRKTPRPQKVWILFLLNLSVCSFVWGVSYYGLEGFSYYPLLDLVDGICSLMIAPLTYFFIWSITDRRRFGWKQYAWFIPGLAFTIFLLFLYLLMEKEQADVLGQKIILRDDDYRTAPGSAEGWLHFSSLYLYSILFILQSVVLLFYSSIKLLRYKKRLADYFSNLEEKSVKNAWAVLSGICILLLMSIFSMLLWDLSYDTHYNYRYLLFPMYTVIVFYMSHHVSKIHFTAENIIPAIDELTDDMPEAGEHPETYIKILPRFIQIIDEEKIFLQPNLSLDDIARRINSNRTYISRLINDEYQCSFYEFISRKRIEFAKELAMQNPLFTQEQIARESGFTHTSTFSRTFKKQTEMNFSNWQKSL